MGEQVLTDQLWKRLQPLIPTPPRRYRFPGRRRVDNRAAVEGILFVVRTGIRWNDLPTSAFGARARPAGGGCRTGTKPGCGSGCTRSCWLSCAPLACWTWRTRWSTPPRTCAQRGDLTGPSPVDRGRPGSKHHLITDAAGIPLAVILTGGNRNDVTQLLPLLDAIPPIRGLRGRPRRRRRRVYADRGYDHDKYRRLLRDARHHPGHRPPRHRARLRTGPHRWVVERTFAWLHGFRRLRIRCERRADIHQAMISLACSIICLRNLRTLR